MDVSFFSPFFAPPSVWRVAYFSNWSIFKLNLIPTGFPLIAVELTLNPERNVPFNRPAEDGHWRNWINNQPKRRSWITIQCVNQCGWRSVGWTRGGGMTKLRKRELRVAGDTRSRLAALRDQKKNKWIKSFIV